MRVRGRLAVLGLTIMSLVSAGVTAARADPPSGLTPAEADIVGFGGDTTSYLLDQLSVDYDTSALRTHNLYSWDPVGSATIQTKGTLKDDPNCDVTRPTGSNTGFAALFATMPTGDGTDPCVDFTGMSRNTMSGDPTGYAFDEFARDAVTWAATSPGEGGHVPEGASLTLTQLANIYGCSNPNTGRPYRWSDLFPGAGADTIVPVLPETASGTRTAFLAALGLTYANLGSCVVDASGGIAVEENEGTNSVFYEPDGVTPNPDVIVPYSVGTYIAQVDLKTVVAQRPGDLVVQDLTNGTTPVAPITGTGAAATITSGPQVYLPAAAYRPLYAVMPNTGTTLVPAISTTMRAVFGTKAQSGWICSDSTATADIRSYGFLPLSVIAPSTCGRLIASL